MKYIKNSRVSVVTVCFNSAKFIRNNIESVNKQKYNNIEHIFIDGKSNDNTLEIIKKYSIRDLTVISEKDKGIYDAMNKGVKIAEGDFICFLNSDDIYSNEFVISEVVESFISQKVDLVYGNIKYFNKNNIHTRTFNSPKKFIDVLQGYQIPHPALFIKSRVLKKLELPFDPRYKIASDFKQQLYLAFNCDLTSSRVNKIIVNMRTGGQSNKNILNRIMGWGEVLKSYQEITNKNGIIFLMKKVLINFLGLIN
tara:strand:+ start:451 stop:1209 length:759 start_codon:yes stop_codon:yes gene_type:complete